MAADFGSSADRSVGRSGNFRSFPAEILQTRPLQAFQGPSFSTRRIPQPVFRYSDRPTVDVSRRSPGPWLRSYCTAR